MVQGTVGAAGLEHGVFGKQTNKQKTKTKDKLAIAVILKTQ